MTAQRLVTKYVEKPWGRDNLPDAFPDGGGRRIGEVWFDGPEDRKPELLVKYIFTSERLSIQVHPDDQQGRARGEAGGKSECWLILDAEPDATLGMGTKKTLDAHALRAAALDGSIEALMDWKPVKAGDFFYIPAGTVHAIGAGITLVEVQQNVDVTYRLYDYGRPRELQLEHGVAVSQAEPYNHPPVTLNGRTNERLLSGKAEPFALDLMALTTSASSIGRDNRASWFIPLDGSGAIDGTRWEAGQCWLLDGCSALKVDQPGRALLACARQ